jgi:wyosine [tRNA(Phe)-imidazoG37] synthetase (radical SAM superfamily)
MTGNIKRIAFGPVPSRRLGQSIGINNIPQKMCTYSCIYCQLGRTFNMQIERKEFYKPEEILDSVKSKVIEAKKREEPIDYLTFVPDGEPTLDINLGDEIDLLRPLEINLAIITNSSLIWNKDVRYDLSKADWVCVKIDAISQNIWKKINRPHRFLKLKKILDGIIEFSHFFKDDLATETMLIQDINDNDSELEKIADFISSLNIKKSYISIPIRPPAEKWVKSADEHSVTKAYQIFKEKNIDVEYLIGYEGNAFAYTGNVEEDLLSITSVHPMKEEALIEFLKKADKDWNVIKKLLNDEKLKEVEYNNEKFYVRKFS